MGMKTMKGLHFAGCAALVAIALGLPLTAVGTSADSSEMADASSSAAGVSATAHAAPAEKHAVKKLLLVGDSMTGWMGERLEAYGRENGFEVATVVWDGSTIKKWGDSASRLKSFIAKEQPDAVMVSLGLNELLEKNPAARYSSSMAAIKGAVGDLPMVWIGPPSWPGKPGGDTLNAWLEKEMGESRFFRSSGLTLGRQSKTNPHPSREGMSKWVDAIVEWIPAHSELSFPGLRKPAGQQMVRGKSFTYRKMRESL